MQDIKGRLHERTNGDIDELRHDGFQQVAEALVADNGDDDLQQLTQQALKVETVALLIYLCSRL